jgi:hypothetical protein
MFLRAKTHRKDGKVHRYWSMVENCRTVEHREGLRQVLYLREINDYLPWEQVRESVEVKRLEQQAELLRALASGLTPRAVLEKFAAMQMVDLHVPTTDARYLILPRYTQPEKDQMKMHPPKQPPPKITPNTAFLA